ncbi:aminotransferase-like domain-containing protein [Streptomyces pseudovenezuelae]|uniref:aminotransferase-like domain-containing protein n=1 Tax=Streptomyces pseudovenezuelae TaxID=67350 RepID=UPI002E805DAA|nr:PLP-dependent aminotransferase family protein [Streptomyces pseudovenezuelae]WUA86190.1 PLP-dependent aminotransferase family protein [Streptomyces pseudovenezuelae]
MFELRQDELHSAFGDPVLGSIGFLNEIMSRYPDAISFAPGAPHLTFLDDFDVARHIDTWIDHQVTQRKLSREQARRLLYEYGPSRGLINELVADALRRDHGIDAGPDAVVVTVGAQEAMLLTLHALCAGPGDLLAVVDPCFVGMRGAARLLNVNVVSVDETEDGVDIDGLRTQCRAARSRGERIRALYVSPDYSNPSGSLTSLGARRRLLALADQEDLLLLEDGAYGFTAPPGEEIPPLKALDTEGRVVHLGTFAKVCLPGTRVGYVVADQLIRTSDGGRRLLADELAVSKSMVTVNTSPICQAVVGGMLLEHGGSLKALAQRKSELYRRNLALLLDALDRHLSPEPGQPQAVSWSRPAGGFFVRMRLPVPADAALLETAASDHGVLWTPMSQFYESGKGENELRLSCSYLEPDRIEEGVARLAVFLRKEVGSGRPSGTRTAPPCR